MKNIKFILIPALAVLLFITSCLEEDNVPYPQISDVKMYMSDVDDQDSLINEVFAGKKVKIIVYSDADIISVWPGAIRQIRKKVNSDVDSTDIVGNPVLIKSDYWSDWGLVGAKGHKTSSMEEGWYCTYTYPSAGTFEMTVVATNHGYNSFDLKQTLYNKTITVK